MNSQICVDASLVIKLGLPEEESDQVEALWREWQLQQREIVAPPLLYYEVTSVLRYAVHRERLCQEEGTLILELLLKLPIRLLAPHNLHVTAWGIAADLGHPAAYDAHYLALAQILSCEFWTADRRLFQSAGSGMPWVKLVSSNDQSSSS